MNLLVVMLSLNSLKARIVLSLPVRTPSNLLLPRLAFSG